LVFPRGRSLARLGVSAGARDGYGCAEGIDSRLAVGMKMKAIAHGSSETDRGIESELREGHVVK
jgi:hypothetical protein